MDGKSDVKQNILDSALMLFSAKGYEGVAISELTSVAGITKPTLYYYFGSKEGLFDAVCRENYSRLNRVIAESAVYHANPKNYHEDIYKALHNLANAFFSFAFENEAFYRLTMANLYVPCSSSVFEVVRKYHFEQFEIIGKMFQDMANVHGNLKGKAKRLAWSFIGAINAFIGLAFNGISGEIHNEDTVKEFVHQFMHGIYA
jgi:AcrR family transcriptional regulator